MWYSIKLRSMVTWKVRKGSTDATRRSADARLCILDCVDLHDCNLIKDDVVHGNECCVQSWRFKVAVHPVAGSVQSL